MFPTAPDPLPNRSRPAPALVAPGQVWEAADVVAYVGILAHQGGWDEMLMVAVPIGLFVALLWIANTRAARQHDDGDRDR